MDIIALVKQTPDTGQLSASMDGLKLSAEGGPRIVNPWDEYTLETAIQAREEHGGKVTALCLGPPEAADALRTALAMGVDEAILVSDPAMADSDSLTSARILVAAIRRIGAFDLIVGGRAAIDGNTAATAVQIAALLEVPLVSYVADLKNLTPSERTLSAVRLLEKARETVTTRLPALITVVKEINEPRYPSLIGIRKAARAGIPVWGCDDLGIDASAVGAGASAVEWRSDLPPVREAKVEMIDGGPADAARILVDRLIEEKVI